MTDTQYNVWRRFNTVPYRRFAFVIDFDPGSDDGYRLLDHDPIVADAPYLAQFAAHMGKVRRNVMSGGHDGPLCYTEVRECDPGTIGHYHSAVRSAPESIISSERRGDFDLTLEGARALDASDPLAKFRNRFVIPRRDDGQQVIYLCGNSLGLQPKQTKEYVDTELLSWALRGVNGHFEGPNPWFEYHEFCTEAAAHIVGALPHEVVMMNALTVNLHLLMTSFYRPTEDRYKIVIEGGAFPSDRYAVASQVRAHGFDPTDAVVELQPREGEALLREEDIEAWLRDNSQSVALVMLSGVNYYTGQYFDLERITRAGHSAGARVGFDLAHAAGNVELKLHEWGPDFAAWCSYKYINSGPGGVAGAFVHDRHSEDHDLVRLAGWWGNDPDLRFSMPDEFVPQRGAGGWQLSNAPILPMAAFRASGDMFLDAKMPALRAKSERLVAFLVALLEELPSGVVEWITPTDPARRGSQVSLRTTLAKELQSELEAAGIVSDFRPPDVVRIAPVPLYNTFEDVWHFADVLQQTVSG